MSFVSLWFYRPKIALDEHQKFRPRMQGRNYRGATQFDRISIHFVRITCAYVRFVRPLQGGSAACCRRLTPAAGSLLTDILGIAPSLRFTVYCDRNNCSLFHIKSKDLHIRRDVSTPVAPLTSLHPPLPLAAWQAVCLSVGAENRQKWSAAPVGTRR